MDMLKYNGAKYYDTKEPNKKNGPIVSLQQQNDDGSRTFSKRPFLFSMEECRLETMPLNYLFYMLWYV